MAFKRIAVGVIALAAIGGGTGFALAASAHPSSGTSNLAASSSSSTSSPSSSPSGKNGNKNGGKHGQHGRHGALLRLRTLQHAEWVTQDPKTHKDVTHEAVVGTITAVSSSSVSVKATDGYTLTFKISSGTKIHVAGTKSKGTASDLKTGAKALAGGVKSGSTVTAAQVLVRK